MAVSDINNYRGSGTVQVFQYGITGLSESTSLIQSKAKTIHDSGELLNMVQDVNTSAAADYVTKARYVEDRTKIDTIKYVYGNDGWYYRLNEAGDAWIKVRYGEDEGIDQMYRDAWRRSGAFCMSWPSLSKVNGIPDRLDVSISGDMSAYDRFLDVVEREPRPCEVRTGGIESTNFPDKFVKLDHIRFDSLNGICPDFTLKAGDRINIKFRPRYPMPNLIYKTNTYLDTAFSDYVDDAPPTTRTNTYSVSSYVKKQLLVSGGIEMIQSSTSPSVTAGKIYYASMWMKAADESSPEYASIEVKDGSSRKLIAAKTWQAGREWRRVWIGFTVKSNTTVTIEFLNNWRVWQYTTYPDIGEMTGAAYGYWNPSSGPSTSVGTYISCLALQEADSVDPDTCPEWSHTTSAYYGYNLWVMPLFMPGTGSSVTDTAGVYSTCYTAGIYSVDKAGLLVKQRQADPDTFDMYWRVWPGTAWAFDNTEYVYKGTAVMKDGWLYIGIYLGSSADDYDCLYDLNSNTAFPLLECTTCTAANRSRYYHTFTNQASGTYPVAIPGKFIVGSPINNNSSTSYYRQHVAIDLKYLSITRRNREIRRWMPAKWNISDVGVAAQNYGCNVDDSGYCVTAAGARGARHYQSEGLWEYVRNTFEEVNFSWSSRRGSTDGTNFVFFSNRPNPTVTSTPPARADRYSRHSVSVKDNANFHWLDRNNLNYVDPDTAVSVVTSFTWVDSSIGELGTNVGNYTWQATPTGTVQASGLGADSQSVYLIKSTVTWKEGNPAVTEEDWGVMCQPDAFYWPVPWVGVNNANFLDTGITVSSAHKIKIGFQLATSAIDANAVTGPILRCNYPGHRVILYTGSENNYACWFCTEGRPAIRAGEFIVTAMNDPVNWEIGNYYIKDLDTGEYAQAFKAVGWPYSVLNTTYGFPSSVTADTDLLEACGEPTDPWSSSDYTWTIGQGYNTGATSNGIIRLYYVRIEDADGTLLFDGRPYYHMGNQQALILDMVSGRAILLASSVTPATDDNDTTAKVGPLKIIPSHNRATRHVVADNFSTSSVAGVADWGSTGKPSLGPYSPCHWFEWLQMVALPNMYIGGYENKQTDRNEIWIHPGAYAGEECPPGMIPLFVNEDDSGELVSAGKFKLVARYKSTAAHQCTADWNELVFPTLDAARGREFLRRGVTSTSGISTYNATYNNSSNAGACGTDFALQNTHVYGITGWEFMCLGFIESAYYRTMYTYLERPGTSALDDHFNSANLLQRKVNGLSDKFATQPGVTGRSGKAYMKGTGMGMGPKVRRTQMSVANVADYNVADSSIIWNRDFAFMWMENFACEHAVQGMGDVYPDNFIQYIPNTIQQDPDASIIFIEGREGYQNESDYDAGYRNGWTKGYQGDLWNSYGFFDDGGATTHLKIYMKQGTAGPTGVNRDDAYGGRRSVKAPRYLILSANKANQLTFANVGQSGGWIPDMIANGTWDRKVAHDVNYYYGGTNTYVKWLGVNIWGAPTNNATWAAMGSIQPGGMSNFTEFDPLFLPTGYGIQYSAGISSGTTLKWRFVGYGGWPSYVNNWDVWTGATPRANYGNYYNSTNANATVMVTCDLTGI